MKAQDLILNVSRRVYTYEKIQIVNYENLRVHIECMDGNKDSRKNFKHSTKKGQFLVEPKVVMLQLLFISFVDYGSSDNHGWLLVGG